MRIRTIKPEFFTHEALYELERETELPIRIAFVGLWCAADREGRFKWEPRRLGVAVLPYDGCDFSRVLDALTTRGFIVKYRVKDAWFGWIPSFLKHQIVNNRERASDYPECPPTQEPDATATREPRVSHASKAEGKGREGEGKEGEGSDAETPTLKRFIGMCGSHNIPDWYAKEKYELWDAKQWRHKETAYNWKKVVPLVARDYVNDGRPRRAETNGHEVPDPEGWREWLTLKSLEYAPHHSALPNWKKAFVEKI